MVLMRGEKNMTILPVLLSLSSYTSGFPKFAVRIGHITASNSWPITAYSESSCPLSVGCPFSRVVVSSTMIARCPTHAVRAPMGMFEVQKFCASRFGIFSGVMAPSVAT